MSGPSRERAIRSAFAVASAFLAVAFGLRKPPRRPKTDSAKKIVPKSGKFSRRKNVVSKHHVYHAIHHNFTTKKPQLAHLVSKKPLQKHPSTSQ
jgi:hypothetical protein